MNNEVFIGGGGETVEDALVKLEATARGPGNFAESFSPKILTFTLAILFKRMYILT